MRIIPALLAGIALASSVPAFASSSSNARSEEQIAKALSGYVAGTPVRCIQLRDIESSEIFDGTAILYRMIGGTLYLNRPRTGGSSLRPDEILVTDTHTPELCSIDVVRLVDPVSRMPSGFVGLDDFVPYRKPRPAH